MREAKRRAYLKDCDRDINDCFSECAKNVLNNNGALKKGQFDRLKKQKAEKVGTTEDDAEAKASHLTSEGRLRNFPPRTRDNGTRLRTGGTAVSTSSSSSSSLYRLDLYGSRQAVVSDRRIRS